jgi:hypothetical protein
MMTGAAGFPALWASLWASQECIEPFGSALALAVEQVPVAIDHVRQRCGDRSGRRAATP